MTKKLEPSDYLGAEVIVTGGAGAEWRGTAIAYRDHPSLMIQQENGMRMMLSADNVRLAEPRPAWHDAKPGEVWEVTVSPSLATANVPAREPHPMQVMLDDSGPIRTLFFVYWNGPDAETVDIEDLEIDTARRLWPEASNG